MSVNKRFNLGRSNLHLSGVNYVSVRLPKASLEALGLVTGMTVECLAYTDPLEIIIRPEVDNPVSVEGYIEQSLSRKTWKLVDDAD